MNAVASNLFYTRIEDSRFIVTKSRPILVILLFNKDENVQVYVRMPFKDIFKRSRARLSAGVRSAAV